MFQNHQMLNRLFYRKNKVLKNNILLLVVTFCITTSFCMHPIHISYTKVDIHSNELTLVIKVFPDDLKQSVNQQFKCNECSEKQQIKYLLQSCKVLVNTKEVQVNFKKTEKQYDAIWYYFTGKVIASNNCNISVVNKLFCNIYKDQKNLVIMSCNSKEQGFTLDYSNQSCSFTN